MEIIARLDQKSFRVVRRKPDGGYCIVSTYLLLSAWTAYRQEIIELMDLRVWFACLELLAKRCGTQNGRRPRYHPAEIRVLVGGSERRIGNALCRLERAGLIRWHESALWVARKTKDFTNLATLTMPSIPDRPVPVPRRILRYLTGLHRPVMIATTVGHLLRGLFLRDGACVSGGRCKASWISEVFGVDLRNVKHARRELTQCGWVIAVPSSQTAMNRWGQAFVLSLDWCFENRLSTPEIPPRRGAIVPHSPPPGENKKLLIGSGNQKPAQRGPVGACAGKGGFRAASFRNVVFADLEQPARTADLFRDAVRSGRVRNTPSDRLLVFAAAARAKSVGLRNPAGLFVWLIRERRWSHINQRDEDRGRAALRAVEDGLPVPVACRQPVPERKSGSASCTACQAAPEAARQVLAGTGAAAYPILAAVSAALSVRGSAHSPQATESLPGTRRWMGPRRELAGYSLVLPKGVL